MKKLLLLLSLTFIPVLNAETYYDYEKVEVEELPTASAETTDKVYIKGNSYYVTESTTLDGSPTYLELGVNYKGQRIYFDYKNPFVEYAYSHSPNSVWIYFDAFYYRNNLDKMGAMYSNRLTPIIDSSYDVVGVNLPSGRTGYYLSDNNEKYNIISFVSSKDFIIKSYYSFTGYEVDKLFSTTPFYEETTYSWKQVNKKDVYLVIENTLYVPNKNLQCYILKDRNTLRGYFNKPTLNSNADYYDFYLDQHYNSIKGTELIETDINCLDNITYNYLYRNDIVEILIFFVIVAGFVIYLPIKILFRFSRRFN
jgi:hypothetical protein